MLRAGAHDIGSFTHACSLASFFRWHVNLSGTSGSIYEGVAIHMELTFPESYPNSPPSASFYTEIPYHGGATKRDDQGRIQLCLNILADFAHVHTEWEHDKDASGWSSAYTVHTILLNLQAFLLDVPNRKDATTTRFIDTCSAFVCPDCGHTGRSPHTWVPPLRVADEVAPAAAEMAVVVEALVKQIKTDQPSLFAGLGAAEARAAFSDALVRAIAAEHAKDSSDDSPHSAALRAIREALTCYVTRSSWRDEVLGFGVSVTNREMTSPCELLSKTAWEDGTRMSVYREPITHFLPLYIDSEHAAKSIALMGPALQSMCGASGPDAECYSAMHVLPKLMNSMIVAVMNGESHASIKFLDGFCMFHRVLLHFALTRPEVAKRIKAEVSKFQQLDPRLREKASVPNLGEWLCYLTVSDVRWADVVSAYLDENFDRNVRWYLQTYPELADPFVDQGRVAKVWAATKVSRTLLQFQVFFLSKIARPDALTLEQVAERYDSMHGRVDDTLKQELQDKCNQLKGDDGGANWSEFFADVGLPSRAQPEMLAWLQRSVENSARKRYHEKGKGGGGKGKGRGKDRSPPRRGRSRSRSPPPPPRYVADRGGDGRRGAPDYDYDRRRWHDDRRGRRSRSRSRSPPRRR